MSTESLDIKAIRARLEAKGGPQYWRSLESVAETPEFQEFLHREFPSSASEWTDPVGRRSFLKLMGASIALAGATGVPAATFVVADGLSALVSVPLVVGAGYLFAHHLPEARRTIRLVELGIVVAVLLAAFVVLRVRRRRRAI